MTNAIRFFCLLLLLLSPVMPGLAQPSTTRLSTSLYKMSVNNGNNMSELKLLAERGFADAQMKVAKACVDNMLYADALKWYSAAADQGVVEAHYQKGHMMMFGCQGGPEQTVVAQPAEAFKFTFMAATNGHFGACYDLAVAHRDGLGCPRDYVIAYAWFSYCADHGNEHSRTALNWLALRLSAEDIQQALVLARDTKAGKWPEFSKERAGHKFKTTVAVTIDLKLSGVVCSPRGNMAVINKKTLAEGETVKLKSTKDEMVDVTCVSVQPNFVQVKVENETALRTLFAGKN